MALKDKVVADVEFNRPNTSSVALALESANAMIAIARIFLARGETDGISNIIVGALRYSTAFHCVGVGSNADEAIRVHEKVLAMFGLPPDHLVRGCLIHPSRAIEFLKSK
jgi:hypothetical protein